MYPTLKPHTLLASVLLALLGPSSALATGMQPETTLVLVNAADGEASLSVRNTDDASALLHTVLQDLPEDPAELLLVTPPVARVEPGQSQLVRFILQASEPITTQRMKRVIFEGIPAKRGDGASQVAMTVRQNLPVIIHPQGLPLKRDPWVLLQWRLEGGELVAHNPSAYVVRLANKLMLLPGEQEASLPTTYVLPGQHIRVALPSGGASATQVRLYPASLYGFSMAPFEASLVRD